MRTPSDITSIYSSTGTYTTTSSIRGLGSLSGIAIRKLGEVVIYGIDSIMIRRRLTQIGERFSDTGHADEQCFNDLLEFSRHTVRKRALRLIMAKIGSLDFGDLAVSAVALRSSADFRHHVSSVLSCLWWDDTDSDTITVSSSSTHDSPPPSRSGKMSPRSAGCESYMVSLPVRDAEQAPDFLLCAPATLYLAVIASLGDQEHSRIIIELGVLSFLRELGCYDIRVHSTYGGLASQLLLRTLTTRLDKVYDHLAYSRVTACLGEKKDTLREEMTGLHLDPYEAYGQLDIDVSTLLESARSFMQTMSNFVMHGDSIFLGRDHTFKKLQSTWLTYLQELRNRQRAIQAAKKIPITQYVIA
ncbi:hypothetical protein VNI00_006456 [Paramarasmius palmivorus]|uniref:Uncharacterized protein n=1 Tax=Paramarasmius palmivorus TaxID=297713 RepID=A0AAW0D4U9_9AGAR